MPTQVLNVTQQQSADDSGNVIFTFGPVPQSLSWQGAISISGIGAQKAAWQATVGAVIWSNWLGQAPSTTIQAAQGLTITVTGTGVQTTAPVVTATLVGSSTDFATTTPIGPTANVPTLVPTGIQTSHLGPFTMGANAERSFDVPSWAQSGIIVLQSSSGLVRVAGTPSGAVYLPWTPLSTQLLPSGQALASFPLAPEIDPIIDVITFQAPGPASTTFSLYFASASPITFPAAQGVIIGTAISNTLTPSNVLTPSSSGIYNLQAATMVCTCGAAAPAFYGANLTATLLSTGTSQSLLGFVAPGLAIASSSISPTTGILTYPGTPVMLTPFGSASPNGQININLQYQQLIP